MFLIIPMPPILADAGSLSLSSFSLPPSVELENVVYIGGQYRFEDFSVLEVSGEDATAYLQSQTTNDLKKLSVGSFHVNSLLDNAANLVSFFYLLRIDEQKYFLVVHNELKDSSLARLNKYVVSEDVDVKEYSSMPYLVIGFKSLQLSDELQGVRCEGLIGGERAYLCFEDQRLEQLNESELKKFLLVSGEPFWKLTLSQLELINNTILRDQGYDKSKGCFLGQETVAKIESRRGAAFRPQILDAHERVDLISGDELKKKAKIGKVIQTFDFGGKQLILASLNRESRVLESEHSVEYPCRFSFTVKSYPLYHAASKALDFYHCAVDFFQAGDEKKAQEYFLKAIEVDPLFEDAYEGLGVLYGRQERFDEAIQLMHKLSDLNSKSVMAHTNLSLYYMKQGDIKTAEEHKSLATVKQFEVLGDQALERKNRERELERQKLELSKRKAMFLEVLEIDEDDPLANHGLSDIEYHEENYQKALEYAKKAIKGDAKFSVAWLLLGKVYMALQDDLNAIETLKHGISVASKQGDLMPANEMQSLLRQLK